MKRALTFCAAAAALCAQQSTVIQTETREVLVETVVAARDGTHMRDLTLQDFRIFEDNKEQKLASARFVSAEAGRSDLVLFFDETGISGRDQADLRRAAADFIDAAVSPRHRMAVVGFNGHLQVRQNFTDNAGRLKDALPQPNGSVMGRDAPMRESVLALGTLGQNLGALPGRKIVVLFSGGLFASAGLRSDLQEVIEVCNRSGVAIYPVDVRQVNASAGMEAQSGRAMQRMQSADVAVDMLYGLAGGTGGFVVKRTNDLLAGLQSIAAEEDAYYVLSYTPPESKEGKCHTLKVKVERSGATLRARNSYCTVKRPDLLAGTVAGKSLEKRAAAGGGNMTATVALPYFYTSPNVARVHLVMDIMPGAVRFEVQKGPNHKDKMHAEVSLLGIASTSDGGVAARFSDALKFDFDSEDRIRDWRSTPIHYEKEFRVAPGKYTFTMAFGEAGQEDTSFGKVTMPLVIDAWEGKGPGLSAIVLSREVHPAADLGLAALTVRRTPLVAEDMQVVPSTGTLFPKGQPGYFYFEAYDADPASVRVRARVLDRRNGEVKWDSLVRTLDVPETANSPMPARARLPLELLKEGPYRLEIVAADKSGKTVVRSADFDVEVDFEIR